MQAAVEELVKLGPLPNEDDADVETLKIYEKSLDKLKTPITDDEARALAKLFGPDSCFGMAWELVHAIESAPGWPLHDVLVNEAGIEWIDRLKQYARNAGLID